MSTRLRRLLIGLLLLAVAACGGGQSRAEPAEPARDHGAGHPGAHRGHGHHHGAHDHDFSDVERWAALFDDPERDAWQRPTEVVELLAIAPGMSVVDLGAGTGYFLPHLAPAVGDSGRVIALDVEPAMVEHMQQRIADNAIPSAEARVVPPDDPQLDPASVDRILVVDTWHHISDRVAYARKLRDALREGGFVLVVDFTLDAPQGPPPEMRLAPEAVAEELRQAGLAPTILGEELPMQYAVRATRE